MKQMMLRAGIKRSPGTVLLWGLFFLMVMLSPCSAETAATPSKKQDAQAVASQDQQGKGKTAFHPSVTAEEAQAKSAEIQQEIDKYTLLTEGLAEEDPKGEPLQKLLSALGTLQSFYLRYPSTLESAEKANKAAAEQGEEGAESILKDAAPPYNLSMYEKIRDEYEVQNQQLQSVLSSIRLVETTGKAAKGAVADAEKKLSQLKEEPTAALTDEELQVRLFLVREAEASLESALLAVELYTLADQTNSIRKQYLEKRAAAYSEALAAVRKDLRYDKADLDQQLVAVGDRTAALQKELTALMVEYEKRKNNHVKSQSALNAAKTDHQKIIAQASLAEKEALMTLSQVSIESVERKLSFLEERKKIWEYRYGLIQGDMDGEKMWDIRSTSTARMESLESIFQVEQKNLASIQASVAAARKELEAVTADTALQNLIRNRVTALNKISEIINGDIAETLNLFSQYGRLHEELGEKIDAVRIAEKVSSYGKEKFLAFWNTSLWSGDDFNVTIAKLVFAVALFTAGFFLSGRLTAFFGRAVFPRFGMDKQAAMAVEKVLFYVFMFAFILTALDLVGIPLTAFAFLGGAMAIGIGFGAQNFFSNLISGFIVVFTKPIRVGDVVEADGVTGTVEEVGTRSTRIKTFDNMDVIIPNSFFLGNRITNWTLTDQKMRRQIDVGVNYGSDVREVERLLLLAAKDHTRVLKSPEPFVFFRDFGANALEFTLYYWIDMANSNAFRVASDLRYRIVALLKEKGIEVALPQINIHMNDAVRQRVPFDIQPAVLHEEHSGKKEADEKKQ